MASKEGMRRFQRMLFEKHNYTVRLDGPENDRLLRHMREQAQPDWEKANAPDGEPALTPEDVVYSLVMTGLAAAEAEAGLIAMIDGRLFTIDGHEAYRRTRDGKPLTHGQWLRQRGCAHERRSPFGPEDDREVCMDCGKVNER